MSNGRSGLSGNRNMPRSRFLRLAGTTLAGASVVGGGALAAGCGGGGSSDGAVEMTFSLFEDPTGTVNALVDRFNEEHRGEIRINFRGMPADSGDHFDQLRTEFQSGSSDIDIIGGDIIWPAQFAANGWILDLSDRFTEEMRSEFLPAPVEGNTYEGAVYGVPFYTDVGFLYYRRDLLEDSGISEAPETYDELKEIANQVVQESGTRYGFVFQGANYEGGVVNGLEYIWNSGGDVLDGNEVTIDSPEAVGGIETERSFVTEGIAPRGVSQYLEQESATLFLRGDAVMMRNVPRMYALASDPNESNIDPEQIGIATLPVADASIPSSSAAGGWNFFVNAQVEDQDAAWEFIRFMTTEDSEKTLALDSSRLPARVALYEDQEILDGLPIARLGLDAVRSARPRPVSPYYSDMSLAMGGAFTDSLNGDAPVQEIMSGLKDDLQEIVDQTD